MKRKFTIASLVTALMLLMSAGIFAQPADSVDIVFSVDMSVQKLTGTFDPNAGDQVDVRGSFNAWSLNNVMSPGVGDPDVYQTVVRVDTAMHEYKFVIENSSGTVWESRDNRMYHATGTEPDLNGDGIPDAVLDTVYFDDIGPDDIFTTQTDVIFQVDMRSAHAFLVDSGFIAFGPTGDTVTVVDSVYIAGNPGINTTPSMDWVWDLPAGDPTLDSLLMNDDGVNGDLMAGDSIYSITITFNVGAPKAPVWKYGVGGPNDNEAGFAENHSSNVESGMVENCFGSNGVGPGMSNWYAPYQDECLSVGITPRDIAEISKTFHLGQNYPNPFNPSTTIEYELTKKADVKLVVYNTLGQQVRVLKQGEQTAGLHQAVWDGKNDEGENVSTGIYLYTLSAGDFSETKKMILMK
ncbi:MAG: T9SS type A sorting domain-containing protein [Aliifodinibius sp.]|nr:T9SS type A sorting domain-containing protein [Fodinibius sp.]